MSIDAIRSLITTDICGVDNLILSQMQSAIPLIEQIGHHIINSGGKRLRPLVVLLVARAVGYQGEQHWHLAAIIEFIHTATLLHDDVVDHSELRRGRKTANAIWGNEASVLVGDFVYSRSFQMMAALNNLRIMEIFADATNTIAEGEVLQMLNRRNTKITEENYMEVIRYKTATLFEAAGKVGAVINQSNEKIIHAMAAYGLHLGIAFQLIDDVLDYTASAEQMGKNIGDDLAEGKATLPLIYAMKKGSVAQKQMIEQAISEGKIEQLQEIQEAIESTKAIDYTYALAKQQADLAITQLMAIPASQYRDALQTLAMFAVERKY